VRRKVYGYVAAFSMAAALTVGMPAGAEELVGAGAAADTVTETQESGAAQESDETKGLAGILSQMLEDPSSVTEMMNCEGSGTVTITVEDGLRSMLQGFMSGMDEESTEDFSWLQSLTVSGAAKAEEGSCDASGSLKLNGVEIVGSGVSYDKESSLLYLALPGLTDQTAVIDVKKILEEMQNAEGMDELAGLTDQATDFMKLFEEESFQELITKLMNVLTEATPEAQTASTTLSVEGLSREVTACTMTWDGATLASMTRQVLEILKDDAFMQELLNHEYIQTLVQLEEAEEDDVVYEVSENGTESVPETEADTRTLYEKYQDALADALENGNFEEALADKAVTLQTALDAEGTLTGFSVDLTQEGQNENVLTAAWLKEDAALGFDFRLGTLLTEEMGLQNAGIRGRATATDKVWKGSVDFFADDVTAYTIYIDELDLTEIENGTWSGSFRLPIDTGDSSGFEMALTLNMKVTRSDDALNSTGTVLLAGSPMVSFEANFTKTADGLTAVSTDGAVELSDEDSAMNYLSGLDFNGLLTNLQSAGVPEEYLSLAGSVLSSLAA